MQLGQKSLSDVVNDSEDCSGVISSTPVTELFTVFSLTEWLLGICNCTWLHMIDTSLITRLIQLTDVAEVNMQLGEGKSQLHI